MTTVLIDKPSTLFRSGIARGIVSKDETAIERDGGKFKAGLIRRMSVITTGEALGHDLWIDHEMLSQVAMAINSQEQGAKVRFTHPGLSGDGLGKLTARAFNAVVEGDRVLADAHMLESAHKSPDGDLAGYVLDLAEEAPDAFGASISFMHDWDSEDEFVENNKGKDGRFVSPDENNANNYPHARVKKLRAVDVVDTPAANPGGMFHAGPFELLENAEAVFDYVFGVTDNPPETTFGVDPSRLKGFVARWAGDRGFALKTKEEIMPDQKLPAGTSMSENVAAEMMAEAALASAPPILVSAPDLFTAEEVAEREKLACQKAGDSALSAARDGLKQFTTLFGAENGAKWFQEGVSLEDAKDKHIAALTAANKDLSTKVDAAKGGLGEEAPLSGTSATADSAQDKLRKQMELQLGPNLAKVALSMKVPEPSRN